MLKEYKEKPKHKSLCSKCDVEQTEPHFLAGATAYLNPMMPVFHYHPKEALLSHQSWKSYVVDVVAEPKPSADSEITATKIVCFGS